MPSGWSSRRCHGVVDRTAANTGAVQAAVLLLIALLLQTALLYLHLVLPVLHITAVDRNRLPVDVAGRQQQQQQQMLPATAE